MNLNKRLCLYLILALAVTAIAFLPSLKNGFTNWDDDRMVTQNPKITSLSPGSIKTMFVSPHEGIYHPLVLLSYAVEYHFFKLDPRPYHLTNLVLHLANCGLVFWLFFLLVENAEVSLFVTVLFGVHPLHVASVAWVAERKDVLYVFFYLGAMISYLFYKKNTREMKYYYLSISLFLLSLLAKPMAVTLPLALILCDYIRQESFCRKSFEEKAPFFALSAIFAVIAVIARKPPESAVMPYTFLDNLLLAFYGLIYYPLKMFAPFKLSCMYPDPPKINGCLPIIYYAAPVVAAAVAVAAAYTKRTRYVVFGAAFYLATILPVLHFFPGGPVVADHYAYVPIIGLFFIAAEGFMLICRKAPVFYKNCLIAGFALVVLFLSILTWHRCEIWADSLTLWQDCIQKFCGRPNMSPAYNNRGNACRDAGDYEKALSDYTKAIDIDPGYSGAYNNRGNIYATRKEFDRALSDYNAAVKIDPQFAAAYYNRANVYAEKRLFALAAAGYTKVIELNSGNADAYYRRGGLYLAAKEYDSAFSDFTRAVSVRPNYAAAFFDRGNIYYIKGAYAAAAGDYTTAVNIDPGFAAAYFNRGNALSRLGRYDPAVVDYTRALRLDPSFAPALHKRAAAYCALKEYKNAMDDLKSLRSMGLKPDPALLEEAGKALER